MVPPAKSSAKVQEVGPKQFVVMVDACRLFDESANTLKRQPSSVACLTFLMIVYIPFDSKESNYRNYKANLFTFTVHRGSLSVSIH